MYDESTNTQSAANIFELRKECYRIQRAAFNGIEDRMQKDYPNLSALCNEYLESLDVQEICRINKGNKIEAIKMIRNKFSGMSLIDSKILADEHFKRLGY